MKTLQTYNIKEVVICAWTLVGVGEGVLACQSGSPTAACCVSIWATMAFYTQHANETVAINKDSTAAWVLCVQTRWHKPTTSLLKGQKQRDVCRAKEAVIESVFYKSALDTKKQPLYFLQDPLHPVFRIAGELHQVSEYSTIKW